MLELFKIKELLTFSLFLHAEKMKIKFKIENYFTLFLFLTVLPNVGFSQSEVKIIKFLAGQTVNDIVLDGDKIWAATEGNGVNELYIKENRVKNYSPENNKLSNGIIFAIEKSRKYIFAGSIDGLFIFDKRRKRWAKRKFGKGGQLGNYIRDLAFDENHKNLWIGRFQYLSRFSLRKRRFYDYDLTINNDEKTNSVTTLKIDKNGFLWTGTDNGLFRIDISDEIVDSLNKDYFSNKHNMFPKSGKMISVSALLFERDNIWIGCNKFVTNENPDFNSGGLYKWDGGIEWKLFDKSTGLGGDGISALAIAGNYIWAGVYDFGKNTKEEYGRGISLINRLTGKVTRIVDERLPSKINAFLFDGSNMWIAADNGLYELNITNNLLNWK